MGEYADEIVDRMIGESSWGRPARRGKRRLSAQPGSDLARARCQAHAAFDPKWKDGGMTRTEAYAWLAKELKIPRDACHMLNFNIEMCNKVVALCTLDDFDVVDP